jgi:hypothetical protein
MEIYCYTSLLPALTPLMAFIATFSSISILYLTVSKSDMVSDGKWCSVITLSFLCIFFSCCPLNSLTNCFHVLNLIFLRCFNFQEAFQIL